MSEKYIKLNREDKYIEGLISSNKNAFVLLTIISLRAKRTDENNFSNLEIGECFLGDYKNYGMTEQQYRTAKKFLECHKIATFKGTTKGTIGKLISNKVFDINPENKITNKKTHKQRTPNERLTTKKNVKNVKNDNNIISKQSLQETEIEICPINSLEENKSDEKININPLIDLYKENIGYQDLFSNKTERKVLTTFVERYGYEKTKSMIEWSLEHQTQFYPATKPTELKKNINKLVLTFNKQGFNTITKI